MIRFLIVLLILPILTFGQNLEVEYLAIVKQRLPENVRQEFIADGLRDQLKQNEEPEPSQYTLVISDKESEFNYVQKISNEQDPSKAVIMVAPAGFGTVYKNLIDSTQRENHDVYGKLYHSVDSLKIIDWKISRDTKTILGFEVRKATAEDEFSVYTVWYAPKIPVSNGPYFYWGLPGLILEAEQISKKMEYKETFIAESIKTLDKKLKINVPDKGKQIRKDEIYDIWQKANDNRNKMYGRDGGLDLD